MTMLDSSKSPPFSTVTRHLRSAPPWTLVGDPGVRRVSEGSASVETREVPRSVPLAPPPDAAVQRLRLDRRVRAPSLLARAGLGRKGCALGTGVPVKLSLSS